MEILVNRCAHQFINQSLHLRTYKQQWRFAIVWKKNERVKREKTTEKIVVRMSQEEPQKEKWIVLRTKRFLKWTFEAVRKWGGRKDAFARTK